MSDVHTGAGVRTALWQRVRELFPDARRAGLVLDGTMRAAWQAAGNELPAPPRGLEVLEVVPYPGGESSKTRDGLAAVQDALLDLRRDEPVVVIGGGATTDLGGFAAATVRRGLSWVAVPTTVVGMADAAIGGKTGINHMRGKNLIGAFHEPAFVLVDVAFLTTCDPRDVRAGAAELYKSGRLGDAEICALLAGGLPDTADGDGWAVLIDKAIAVKQAHVEGDLRDAGKRRLLNYGHTVGHALETLLGNHKIRHGEAVAIGMEIAMRMAVSRDLVEADGAAAQTAVLEGIGLPTALPEGVAVDDVLDTIAVDKKRTAGAAHTFVLPTGTEGAVVVSDVTDDEVRAALA